MAVVCDQNGVHVGLTTDTTDWLNAHKSLPNFSYYREIDGEQRLYQLLNGTWYLQ